MKALLYIEKRALAPSAHASFFAAFFKAASSRIIPAPVRICPMPAIPEMAAENPLDRVRPSTWVTPRTNSITAVNGTPML